MPAIVRSAILAILLAGSLLGSQLAAGPRALAADRVPDFNVEPSCRGAGNATIKGRDETACKRDEQDARTKLDQEWGQFDADQHSHCVRLSSLGGSPSYVELLTCLELAKQSASLPPESKLEIRSTRP